MHSMAQPLKFDSPMMNSEMLLARKGNVLCMVPNFAPLHSALSIIEQCIQVIKFFWDYYTQCYPWQWLVGWWACCFYHYPCFRRIESRSTHLPRSQSELYLTVDHTFEEAKWQTGTSAGRTMKDMDERQCLIGFLWFSWGKGLRLLWFTAFLLEAKQWKQVALPDVGQRWKGMQYIFAIALATGTTQLPNRKE